MPESYILGRREVGEWGVREVSNQTIRADAPLSDVVEWMYRFLMWNYKKADVNRELIKLIEKEQK